MLGIGIVTYNRLDHLQSCVQSVRQFTTSAHQLVVADDGSTDGTREWCAAEGILLVGRENHGVCWNKNRALFVLQELGCDPILLLEDDCWPIAPGWEQDWRIATACFGHVSYAHKKLARWTISGSGRPTDPFVNNKATAQCSSISAMLMRKVGFFDSRFKGYGVGHAEWTTRIKRAGFGFKYAELEDGRRARANLYITGGVEGHDAPTFKDRDNIARNEALFDSLKQEPIYRHPWSQDQERAQFAEEMKDAGIGLDRYLRATTATASPLKRITYSKPLRDVLDNMLGEEGSFAVASGWIEGLALDLPIHGTEVVPCLNYALLHLLKERMKPDWKVLEFGAGYSSVWWSRHAALVHAMEEDPAWAETARNLADPGKLLITQAPAVDFPAKAWELEESFHIVVVDCSNGAACAIAALPRLQATGVLILNHSERPEYLDLIAAWKGRGLRELRLTAPAPGSLRMEVASVLYRAENCLGL